MFYRIPSGSPCWLDISWRKQQCAILLRLHENIISKIPAIAPEIPFIQQHLKEFGFSVFEPDFSKNFGFEKAFINNGKKGRFQEFLLPMPVVSFFTENTCPECGGTGKHEIFDNCLRCRGTGKEREHSWKQAFAVSATLSLLSCFWIYNDTRTDCKEEQLLIFETTTRRGYHGGGLSGFLGDSLVEWLATFPDEYLIEESVAAMKCAYYKMFSDEKSDFNRFIARVRTHGHVIMDCPGNACGIHPESWRNKVEGHAFSCHNVDSPMQQLTLLAGLAALHDKARKEMKK